MAASVMADCYMQNPRGSNDRLNEANTNRNNDNRLFDSQNNAQGGYCWGPALSFYEGSKLTIEWTTQHSCGQQNAQCNLIIQYMCTDSNGNSSLLMRDGETTNTISPNPSPSAGTSYYNYIDPATNQYYYGMHESYDYYYQCIVRQRNQGLFTADQNVGGNNGAQNTRQNAGGTVYGFECAEERDYYPYWHPSPWRDIAVLTTQTSNCGYYKSQSQNVMAKNYCWGSSQSQMNANNQGSCSSAGGSWLTVPAFKLPAPACVAAPFGRDNHLGNGLNGYTQDYNWTIPKKGTPGLGCISTSSCVCALRIRYNISTSETSNWGNSMADWKVSGASSPIKTNPYIMIASTGMNLSLALNTAQYGRTFQDRSYVWKIISRPKNVYETANIWNLNVRGKRGNIVQVYPATEYDFAPTQLTVKIGDYIHFQWTGCDTNPAGNAGEGIDQTDRSNIVQILDRSYNKPLLDTGFKQYGVTPLFDSMAVRDNMAFIGQQNCLSLDALNTKNGNNANNIDVDPQNCAKLNAAATPYFNGGLMQVNKTGTFYYMSSRNNNFSNRTQKGTIVVTLLLPAYAIALVVIGAVAATGAGSAAAAVIYSKRNPHSRIAGFVGKMPLLNRI